MQVGLLLSLLLSSHTVAGTADGEPPLKCAGIYSFFSGTQSSEDALRHFRNEDGKLIQQVALETGIGGEIIGFESPIKLGERAEVRNLMREALSHFGIPPEAVTTGEEGGQLKLFVDLTVISNVSLRTHLIYHASRFNLRRFHQQLEIAGPRLRRVLLDAEPEVVHRIIEGLTPEDALVLHELHRKLAPRGEKVITLKDLLCG